MTPDQRARHAARFPEELKPNPGYVYEGPRVVVIDGERCIEVDAGILPWAVSVNRHAPKKIPRTQ